MFGRRTCYGKVRLADIGVKVFLILLFPLTISFHYSNLSAPRPILWEEFLRLIGIPLFFLLAGFMIMQGALDKSLRNQRKTKARDIDWSKEKYQELADALKGAGIDLSKTVGKVEVADRWCVQFYQRPRHNDLARFLGGLSVFLLTLFKSYQEMSLGAAVFLSYVMACLFGHSLATLMLRVVDIFFPRLELLITSRVISHLRDEPTKLRVLVAHEFSHEKHRDPLKKLFWKSVGEVSRIWLSVIVFHLLWLLLIMIRQQVAPPKIALLIVFLLGMACWYVATIRVRKLIPLFQELRADLDAVKSASDRAALAEMLAGIPVESKFDAVLHRRGSLKATVIRLITRFRKANEIRLTNEQREHMKPRVGMLNTGAINLISSGAVRRKLFFAYGSVFMCLTPFLYIYTR